MGKMFAYVPLDVNTINLFVSVLIVSLLEYRNKTPFSDHPYPPPPAAVIDALSAVSRPTPTKGRAEATSLVVPPKVTGLVVPSKRENLAGKQVLLLYATPTRATTNDIHRTPDSQQARSILVHIGSITTSLSHHTLPLYFLPANKSVMKQDQSSSNKTSSSPRRPARSTLY